MKWINLLVAAAIAVGIAPSEQAWAETAHLRVGKAAGISFSQVPVDVAEQEGIFAKNGLDVEVSSFGGGGSLVQALLSDSIDVGIVGTPELSLAAKGAPFKAIGLVTMAPVDLVLYVNTGGQFDSISDIKGKKVGVTGLHTLTAWVTMTLANKEGWGNDGIQLVTSRSPAELIALVRTNEIDGMIGDLTMGFDLEAKHQAKILVHFGDLIPRFPTNIVVASDKAIADRPAALTAFMAGWLQTLAFVRNHKNEAVPIFSAVMQRPPDVVSRVYDILVPPGYFAYDARFDRDGLDALASAYVEMGLLDQKPDLSTLHTEKFLPPRQ